MGIQIAEREIAATCQPLGQASTLPSKFYVDPGVYSAELERIFSSAWLCVGRADGLAEPDNFLVQEIGNESIIIVRGKDSRLSAFYNVCRHRGSRIVTAPEGKAGVFECPYHGWVYSSDGKLVSSPHMDESFDKERGGLVSAKLETWQGFIFINLNPKADSLQSYLGDLYTRFERYHVEDLALVKRIRYDVEANWKLIAENYLECYHCPLIHPELNRITPYLTSRRYQAAELPRGSWIGSWMEIAGDYTTLSLTGRSTRPFITGARDEDRKRVYYNIIFPNLFLSLHPDYVLVHTVWPSTIDRSRVICEWYFPKESTARSDFDPSDAIGFWDLVNKQDWTACELNQKGVRSRAYQGRYSLREDLVHKFDQYIISKIV